MGDENENGKVFSTGTELIEVLLSLRIYTEVGDGKHCSKRKKVNGWSPPVTQK